MGFFEDALGSFGLDSLFGDTGISDVLDIIPGGSDVFDFGSALVPESDDSGFLSDILGMGGDVLDFFTPDSTSGLAGLAIAAQTLGSIFTDPGALTDQQKIAADLARDQFEFSKEQSALDAELRREAIAAQAGAASAAAGATLEAARKRALTQILQSRMSAQGNAADRQMAARRGQAELAAQAGQATAQRAQQTGQLGQQGAQGLGSLIIRGLQR